jgi:predicted acylesterase/phospholipase RssA
MIESRRGQRTQIPLRGIRVHLAGSVPEKATSQEADGIKAFVQRFASELFREGGSIVHGSHSTLMEPLKSAAEAYIGAGGPRDALTLVRAAKWATTDGQLAEIAAERGYAAVHIIPGAQGSRTEGLVSMREWMAERCDVVVAIGGKWYDANKEQAGVPEELEEALRRGKAAFAIAGFAGAIKGYLNDDRTAYSRLRNGLSEDANRDLAACVDVERLASTIILQLKLLPLVREDIPSGRLFRVLCLDGGGLRGAFTAAVLAKWDEMLDKNTVREFARHFDMIAGTSTGAILAIGLGLGLSPNQMLHFYKTQGQRIFPKERRLRHWLKSKHDSQTLRDTLESVFGARTLSRDSCCRLVIPTVRALHGESEVIVTAHAQDRPDFRDISAVEAALASSAAPTYFDEAFVEDAVSNQPYLDGGIWANNPVLPAIAEAVRHLKVPLDRIDVLSVGTLGNEADFAKSLGEGKAGWAVYCADLFFAAQEHAAARLADSLLGRSRHLRVNQQTPSSIMLDDTDAIDDMVRRGANVGQDSFISVRSRFLDGFYAEDWRAAANSYVGG